MSEVAQQSAAVRRPAYCSSARNSRRGWKRAGEGDGIEEARWDSELHCVGGQAALGEGAPFLARIEAGAAKECEVGARAGYVPRAYGSGGGSGSGGGRGRCGGGRGAAGGRKSR